jgi:peptidoglycan/LPS O-acetylase OafA/YrhL
LRFFAALHVLAFHSHLDRLGDWPAGVKQVIGTGYVAVNLFFILSGFILAYTYAPGPTAAPVRCRPFWAARFARLYPVYLLGFVLAGPFALEGWLPPNAPPGAAGRLALIGPSTLTLTQAWLPQWALVWNSPGWSLSAEAFFYFLFPFLALPVARLNRRQALLAVAGFWLLSLVPPACCLLAQPGGMWLRAVELNPLLRLPEFLLGMALGRCFVLRDPRTGPATRPGFGRALSLLALAGIVAVLSVGGHLPRVCLHNGLLSPLFALLIYSLAREKCLPARLLSARALVVLGEASYALYILHVPLRAWLYRVLYWLGLEVELSWPLFLGYAALSVATAVLVYYLVERPAQKWLRQRVFRLSEGPGPSGGTPPRHDPPAPAGRRRAHGEAVRRTLSPCPEAAGRHVSLAEGT